MRRLLLLIPVLIIAVVISGCGVNKHRSSEKYPQRIKTSAPATEESNAPVTTKSAPGVVRVSGTDLNSLTSNAIQAYYNSGGTSNVQFTNAESAAAFAQLCRGETDVVASHAVVSEAELHLCNTNHDQLVQFQVASDAIVIAMKNETDVGADCLTMHQVYDTFRAGSPIFNWSQLGYDNVPLKITGPGPGNPVFNLFGQLVFNTTSPGLIDFSTGYVPQPNSKAARLYVTGAEGDTASAGFLAVRRTNLSNLDKLLHGATETLDGADQAVNSALFQIHKGERDHWTEALMNHYRNLLKFYERKKSHATSEFKALRAQHIVDSDLLRASEQATQREASQIGRIGIFHFSYYQLFEEQLRPLEITRNGVEDCIFPSQITITNGTYPLANRLFLTTTVAELQRAETRSFINSYLSNVDNLVTSEELVPVPAQMLRHEREILSGSRAPHIINPGA